MKCEKTFQINDKGNCLLEMWFCCVVLYLSSELLLMLKLKKLIGFGANLSLHSHLSARTEANSASFLVCTYD